MLRKRLIIYILAVIAAIFPLSATFSEQVSLEEEKNVATAEECAYMGVKKCAFCHIRLDDSVRVWAITKHANALAVLRTPAARKYSENPEEDPKCLECHVTGTISGRIQDEDAQQFPMTDEFQGVQCEMCHGPGTLYKNTMARALPKYRELNEQECTRRGLVIPTEQTCRKCHNEDCPVFDGFDFEEAVKLIKHGEKESKCEYIGQEGCVFCHVKADEFAATWVILKHINAFSVLRTKLAEKFSADPVNDEKCLECHATGLNAPGGYSIGDAANRKLEGVQCEMCHGWGYSYVATMVKAKVLDKYGVKDECVRHGLAIPDEESCRRCHNENCPVYTGFDFEASLEQIKHDKVFKKH